MNFLEYFIRYTLVRIINRLLKPKNLLVIVIICLVVFFFLKYETSAVYTGNETYTDPNNTIVIAYNSICNDFIFRLDKFKNNSNMSFLMGYLSNPQYGYYLYYGNINGSSMLDGINYTQNNLNVAVYYLGDPYMDSSSYSNYIGIDCEIKLNKGIYYIFTFTDNTMELVSPTNVNMPSALYNYRADVVTNYLMNSSEEETNDIVGAINQQTNSINEQTNTIQQQNEYLQQQPTSSDFSSSDLPSDSGVSDITSSGFDSIFTMFYDTFTRAPNGSDLIEIPIPFTGKRFFLNYNYTQNYVPQEIQSIVNMFWYYVGSVFILKDLLKKIEKLKTGDVEHIQDNNIKGDLL